MWEIYAYQNSDSLFGVFNAIAAIFGAGDYLASVAAVAFFGFAAALIAYAFAPERLQGWKWLGTVVMVYSIMIVPKVSVGIVDQTGGSPERIVSNVPFGVALFGGVTNIIGSTLTNLFETAFQTIPGNGSMPSQLSYSQNGLMFGNRLISHTGRIMFQDPNFRTDLVNFINNCTMYDLVDGTLDPVAFSQSPDVWSMMANPNPARFSTLTGSGAAVTIDTCPNVYANLNGRIPVQVTQLQGTLAFTMNPTLPTATASSVIVDQIQQAYLKDNIANAAASAADLIRQNAVINAIKDTSQIIGQKINDPASMILAVGRSQAVAQTNAAWINYGKVAEQALPVFRNVVEAVTYALFPLFVLLLLLTHGHGTMRSIKAYTEILIWIQLWPPLYAVLNYIASVYASYDLASAADLGNGQTALSLQTASTIYSGAISGEAVVGYLVMSIPFIAWAAVKGMEHMGSALVGGLSGLQANLSNATGSAATGNVSMGNVAMDQMQLSPNRTSSFMKTWQDNATGNTISSNSMNGLSSVSLLRNQGFASHVVSMRISEQEVTSANKQVDAARSEAVSASNERAAVLTDAFTKGLAKYRSARNSEGESTSGFEQTGQNLDRMDQIAKSLADRTGLSQSQVANIAFGAAAHAGVSTAILGKTVDVGAEVNARAAKNYQSTLSSEQQKVLNAISSEQMSEFKQFGERVSHDSGFVNAISADLMEANDLSSRLSHSASRTQRADAALADRVAFAERISSAKEHGESISIDIAQDPHNVEMFLRYAQRYGGTSAAAFAMFEAELARQGLRPNRVFTDGTAMPTTFEDVRALHDTESKDSSVNPAINYINSENRSRVSKVNSAVPGNLPYSVESNVRSEVQKRGKELHEQIDSASDSFDKKAEVVHTSDGTLKSKKSLLLQSGKQVGQDAGATLDNAKDLIKDWKK